jgi:organic hydroperoxide reductase OsmC/OhrA
MSTFRAQTTWTRTRDDFSYDHYDRDHEVRWGSGQAAAASAAPEYLGSADRLNPEETLVGALSSCHMLTFLAIAARKRLVVDAYSDAAEGVLGKNDAGKLAITEVTLRPVVRFAPGVAVDPAALARMHEAAHANCFIAQTVKASVRIVAPEAAGA